MRTDSQDTVVDRPGLWGVIQESHDGGRVRRLGVEHVNNKLFVGEQHEPCHRRSSLAGRVLGRIEGTDTFPGAPQHG